jgi:lipopolysaccharide biosynthesis glycosyltransferase
MNICASFDRNYLPLFINTAFSIINSHRECPKFHLILDSQATKDALIREIRGRDLPTEHFDLVLFSSKHLSFFERSEGRIEQRLDIRPINYAQILVSEYFPDLRRYIWLEADQIVLKDLRKLWGLDLGHKVLGACEVPAVYADNVAFAFNGSNFPYFNAGVLLVSVDNWKANDITQKCIEYIQLNKSNRIYQFYAQGALNLALRGEFFQLPQSFNYTSYPNFRFKIDPNYISGPAKYTGAIDWSEVCILHYNGKAIFGQSEMSELYKAHDITKVTCVE